MAVAAFNAEIAPVLLQAEGFWKDVDSATSEMLEGAAVQVWFGRPNRFVLALGGDADVFADVKLNPICDVYSAVPGGPSPEQRRDMRRQLAGVETLLATLEECKQRLLDGLKR